MPLKIIIIGYVELISILCISNTNCLILQNNEKSR